MFHTCGPQPSVTPLYHSRGRSLASQEPRERGGEAERERDQQFPDAADLCVAVADVVGATRHLRRDGSLRLNHLDAHCCKSEQQATEQPSERGFQVAHDPPFYDAPACARSSAVGEESGDNPRNRTSTLSRI